MYLMNLHQLRWTQLRFAEFIHHFILWLGKTLFIEDKFHISYFLQLNHHTQKSLAPHFSCFILWFADTLFRENQLYI